MTGGCASSLSGACDLQERALLGLGVAEELYSWCPHTKRAISGVFVTIDGVISGFSEIWKERPALGALQS